MRKSVYFNLFALSFAVMALEMLSIRLIAPYFGNTTYTWGIIISIFLIGSSLGYYLGGRGCDSANRDKTLIWHYLATLVSIALILPLENGLLPRLANIPPVTATFIAMTSLFLLPNVFMSAIITAITKRGLDKAYSGISLGKYHMTSAIGSVFGTLATTFLLIPNARLEIVFAGILVLLGAGFLLILRIWRSLLPRYALAAFLLAFSPLLAFMPTGGGNVVYSAKSSYHNIYVHQTDRLLDSDGVQKGDFLLLTFGRVSGVQSALDRNRPDELVLNYTRAIRDLQEAHMAEARSVFMIGHGGGSLTRAMEQGGRDVVVAELDEAVLRVSQQIFGYTGNSVVIGDGRNILRQQSRRFDVIVLDAYHNSQSLPFHLITREFFTLTRNRLSDNGVLIINAIGNPAGDSVINALVATLRTAYPHVKLYKTEAGDWHQNLEIVASPRPLVALPVKGVYETPTEPKGLIVEDRNSRLIEAQ